MFPESFKGSVVQQFADSILNINKVHNVVEEDIEKNVI